jgi:hypothetical protein
MTRRPVRTVQPRPDPGLSANCRAQHGFTHSAGSVNCTGCPCICHGVSVPADFRARVAAQRERRREEDERLEA